jgi:8-oxo-dGTP diphosphatase
MTADAQSTNNNNNQTGTRSFSEPVGAPTIRVSLIIINSEEQILLVKHKKKTREYWVLPGGHLEFGETVETCALRELKEETNLDGEFQKTVAISQSIATDGSRHILNIYCLVKTVTSSSIKLDAAEEIITEVAFKPLDELSQLTVYPDINQFISQSHKDGWLQAGIAELQTPWN